MNAPSHAAAQSTLSYFGSLMTIHANAETTGGRCALVEFSGAPGIEPPLHVHEREDETFYVLEGRLTAFCGSDEIVVRAANLHCYRGASRTPFASIRPPYDVWWWSHLRASKTTSGRSAQMLQQPSRMSGA